MGTTRRNNRKLIRGMLIALIVILSLILSILVAAVIYIEVTLGKLSRVDRVDITKDPLYQQMLNDGQLLETDESVINILLIGQDRRPGEGRQRSDSMILCTINMKNKTLTMTSFMRDMRVEIPGYNPNKLNATYQMGGMELLDKTLLYNFGVVVDANIEMDFNGFMSLIDTIGGVDIEMTQEEADYLNRRGNWGVDESTAWTWDLKAGKNHLTGEQALAYCRDRFSDPTSDFGRTARQRKVLSAMLESSKKLSVLELNNLLQKLLDMNIMTTDMTNNQIMTYTKSILPILNQLKVKNLRIPADGTYSNDGSYLVPNIEKNKQLLAEAMAG